MLPLPEVIVTLAPGNNEPLNMFVPLRLAIVCADSDTKPLGNCPLPLKIPLGNCALLLNIPLGNCPLPLITPLGNESIIC